MYPFEKEKGQCLDNRIGLFHVSNKFTRNLGRQKHIPAITKYKIGKKNKLRRKLDNEVNRNNENENYWAKHWEKLQKQIPDLSIYSKLDIVQKGTLQKGENENLLSVKQIFKGFSFYFNGITTEKYGSENSNLSQLHLSHLSTAWCHCSTSYSKETIDSYYLR